MPHMGISVRLVHASKDYVVEHLFRESLREYHLEALEKRRPRIFGGMPGRDTKAPPSPPPPPRPTVSGWVGGVVGVRTRGGAPPPPRAEDMLTTTLASRPLNAQAFSSGGRMLDHVRPLPLSPVPPPPLPPTIRCMVHTGGGILRGS